MFNQNQTFCPLESDPGAQCKPDSHVPAARGHPGGWESAVLCSPSRGAGSSWDGRRGCLWLLGLSPHRVSLCSWGPDDDGKTVDGPHQLGKVKPGPSSPGGASRACGFLPARSGRQGHVAVTLSTSVCVPRCQQRFPCHCVAGRGSAVVGGQRSGRAGGASQGEAGSSRKRLFHNLCYCADNSCSPQDPLCSAG